jgi:hypothetical protein
LQTYFKFLAFIAVFTFFRVCICGIYIFRCSGLLFLTCDSWWCVLHFSQLFLIKLFTSWWKQVASTMQCLLQVSVTTEIVHVKAVYITYAIKYFVHSCSQNSRHNTCCVLSASQETILITAWYRKGTIYDGPTVMKHNKFYSMGCWWW